MSKNWYPYCIKIFRANCDFSTCFYPRFVHWPNLNTSHLLQWKVVLLCVWKHEHGSSKPNFKVLIGWGNGRPYKAHFREKGKIARSLENRWRAKLEAIAEILQCSGKFYQIVSYTEWNIIIHHNTEPRKFEDELTETEQIKQKELSSRNNWGP